MNTFFRTILLIAAGAALVYYSMSLRKEKHPKAAPADVQKKGVAILNSQIKAINASEFGKSSRGQLLTDRIESVLDRNGIIFTSDILGGEKALCIREMLADEIWYVQVSKVSNGKYTQQHPHEIAEVVYHEAVHSLKAGYFQSSVQEECDAFVAGFQAEAAAQGIEPKDVITLEDVPIARFVDKHYEGLTDMPEYEPIAESMEWLKKRSGL